MNNRALTIVIYIWLIFRWISSFQKLPTDVLPDLDRPRVTIFTEVEWRAPEEVEQLVTSPIERVMNGAPWVIAVRSSSTIWLSIINIEFDRWSKVLENRQVINELLQTVDLPEDADPLLWPTASLLWEIVWVGLTSPWGTHSSTELRSIAERQVKQQLLTLPGIAQIIVMWGAPKQFQILLDPIKLKNYWLSYSDILERVENANVNRWWWFMTDSNQEAPIRLIGRTTDTSEIESLIVWEREAWPILLSQVAKVTFGPDPNLRWDASVNGKPWTILRIVKQPGINTLDMSAQIDDVMNELKWSLPEDVALNTELFRQERFISEWLANVTSSLLQATIVIVLIITVFLMNGRLTLITLMSVPLSILITFIIFRLMWLGINVMTLWGITMAIGELVDDSIVGIENIRRRLRNRKEANQLWTFKEILETIFDAINEVRGPIFYTTVLWVLAFIPFVSLPWLDGRMLAPIGIAYITSLICSTLISVSIMPVMASYLLPSALKKQTKSEQDRAEPQPWFAHDDTIVVKRIKNIALRGVRFSMTYPKAIFGTMLACIPVFVLLYSFAGKQWLPPLNEPSLTIWVVTPLGSSLEHMRSVADDFTAKLIQIEGIENVAMTLWRAEADAHANGPNIAELEVHTNKDIRSQKDIIADVQTIADGYKWVANFGIWRPITHRIQELQSGVRAPIVIKVFGPDLDVIDGIANQILTRMENTDGIVNAQMQQEFLIPQVSIELNKKLALSYGIAWWDIIEEVEQWLLWIEISEVLDGIARYPLIVKFDPSRTNDLRSLSTLPVGENKQQPVTLWQIADIKTIQSQNTISHDNLQRRKVISAFVQWKDVVSAVEEVRQWVISNVQLPAWYRVSYEWDYASQKEANRNLMLISIVVLVCIYFVLFTVLKKHRIVSQILIDVTTAFLWGMIAIAISGNVVSTAHMVWFVSLLWIVSRNGILLIQHYMNLMENKWMAFDENLIIKWSLERVIPVLMTALTSWLWLLPLILWAATAAWKETLAPIAIVTFGWLMVASIIEIFLRPWVFYWMNKGKDIIGSDKENIRI